MSDDDAAGKSKMDLDCEMAITNQMGNGGDFQVVDEAEVLELAKANGYDLNRYAVCLPYLQKFSMEERVTGFLGILRLTEEMGWLDAWASSMTRNCEIQALKSHPDDVAIFRRSCAALKKSIEYEVLHGRGQLYKLSQTSDLGNRKPSGTDPLFNLASIPFDIDD